MTDREKARDLGNQSAALASSIADVLNDTLDALARSESALAAATEALREIHRLVRTRRTSLHMDGTEKFSQPILAQINSIARAALAVPDDTKEGT